MTGMTEVYVLDEQGATFAFTDREVALEAYEDERRRGAVRLVLFTAQAPKIITGDSCALADWCASNAEPVEFIRGTRGIWSED